MLLDWDSHIITIIREFMLLLTNFKILVIILLIINTIKYLLEQQRRDQQRREATNRTATKRPARERIYRR